MTSPLFSVAIPTRNRAYILPQAIESVLKQSFSNFELVISNNASQDNTHEIVTQYQDPRIRYFVQEKFLNINQNFEFALNCTNGKYVIFLGDDDYLHPEFLSQVEIVLKQNPNLSLVYSGRQCIDIKTKKISLQAYGNEIYYKNLYEWLNRKKEKTVLNLSGVVLHRDRLMSLNIFQFADEGGWGLDDLMYMALCTLGGTYGIRDILVTMSVGVHDNTVANTEPEIVLQSARVNKQRMLDMIDKYVDAGYERKVSQKYVLRHYQDKFFIGAFFKKHVFFAKANLKTYLCDLKKNNFSFLSLTLYPKFFVSILIMLLPLGARKKISKYVR